MLNLKNYLANRIKQLNGKRRTYRNGGCGGGGWVCGGLNPTGSVIPEFGRQI